MPTLIHRLTHPGDVAASAVVSRLRRRRGGHVGPCACHLSGLYAGPTCALYLCTGRAPVRRLSPVDADAP